VLILRLPSVARTRHLYSPPSAFTAPAVAAWLLSDTCCSASGAPRFCALPGRMFAVVQRGCVCVCQCNIDPEASHSGRETHSASW